MYDEAIDSSTTLVRLTEIVRRDSSFSKTAMLRAMMQIINRRREAGPERDAGLATVINYSHRWRHMPEVCRRAAEELLMSPTAKNEHLARILLHLDGDLRTRAGTRMVANGVDDHHHRQWLETYLPALMNVQDTSEKVISRNIFKILTQ